MMTLPRVWARLTAVQGRLCGGQCISDPRVWVGAPTEACVWAWCAVPPGRELAPNSNGMGWTKRSSLLLHPGDIFVPGLESYPKPTREPGRYLRGCSRLDWPGSREVQA